MSNLLDKSLDEIIGSRKTAKKTPQRVGRSSRTNNNGNTRSATKVSSKAVGVRKRAPVARNPAAVNSKRVAKIVDRTVNSFGSNRISIEGMPRDIKRESIREFFQQAIGGVVSVMLSYNEKGVSTGFATVTFKNNDRAAKAVQELNGAPIDNNRRKLRIQLIVDPTKSAAPSNLGQSLAARIGTPVSKPVQKKKPAPRAVGKKQPVQKKKPAKAPKKSLEDLDREMADYFKS